MTDFSNEKSASLKAEMQQTDNVNVTNEKHRAITLACEEHDLDTLIQLADSPGGLLDDQLRRAAWPLLLRCEVKPAANITNSDQSWESLPPHRDEEQVQRDVERAFVYYPNQDSAEAIQINKRKLFDLIVRVLRTHRMLCYFQGYHDIVQVLLLVLGEDAFVSVARLSLCRIRDYMLPTLAPAIKHLRLIPGILQLADAELASHLSQTEPFFALSATLTLYAHDIQEYSDIARLYDFILAHEPVMTIYLFASIILRRRTELMDIPLEEPEMLHFTLSKLPQPLDLEGLIASTLKLFKSCPPEQLPKGAWWKISPNSVLKTARSIDSHQSVEDAERLFHKQEKEMIREEQVQKGLMYLDKNKMPIASIGTALLIGGLAIWLQRSGHSQTILAGIWRIVDLVQSRR